MGRNELKKSGLITAGLVIGIIGLVLSAVPIINNFAAILGVLAIIFGIVGIGYSKTMLTSRLVNSQRRLMSMVLIKLH